MKVVQEDLDIVETLELDGDKYKRMYSDEVFVAFDIKEATNTVYL